MTDPQVANMAVTLSEKMASEGLAADATPDDVMEFFESLWEHAHGRFPGLPAVGVREAFPPEVVDAVVETTLAALRSKTN